MKFPSQRSRFPASRHSSPAGKHAVAMEELAKALRAIPTILADNGGYDAAELISRVRSAAAPDGGAEYRMDGDY